MLDFFRGDRPWGQLGRLVGRLDKRSETRRAMMDDEELATVVAGRITAPEEVENRTPSIEDWDWLDELTAVISDMVSQAVSALLAPHTKTGKAPPATAAPRPETATQAAIRKRVAELDETAETRILQAVKGE